VFSGGGDTQICALLVGGWLKAVMCNSGWGIGRQLFGFLVGGWWYAVRCLSRSG
jgi:hypothetical protein